jgi:RNA polymerase sigma factor (sigma-70 family)
MSTSASAPDVALWYERYRSSVRGIAARVTGNPDDAEDAVHDAFLAAWRARARFDAERDPLPWLVTITRRKALTIAAARTRAVRATLAPQTLPSAEDEALLRESDACVRALVRDEPALALHALDGLPARAVGETLGVPLRTAASRIRRARGRMKAALPATTLCLARSKPA